MLDREPDLRVVAHAGSLAEARRELAVLRGILDVVLADLGLPDGSGLDLLPVLQERFPAASLVVLTASSDRRDHARAVAAGAASILHKSVSIPEIVGAIRRLRAGEPLLSHQEVSALLRLARQIHADHERAQTAQARLTPREREILQALADGLSDKEIAARLGIAPRTVATHMAAILGKLKAESRLQAVLLGIKYGIVAPG